MTVAPPGAVQLTERLVDECTVTAGASGLPGGGSLLVTVPVAVSVAVTGNDVPETFRLTVKVSSASRSASSAVATVKVCVSFFVPAKVSAAVFSV